MLRLRDCYVTNWLLVCRKQANEGAIVGTAVQTRVMATVSRRQFIAQSTALLPTVLACTESIAGPDIAAGNGIDVTRDAVRLDLTRIPALNRVGGSLVVAEANIIVLRLGPDDFRAFSNICTHAGCGIYEFARERMRCQCHGSEFDLDGLNVAGPAPAPLPRLVLQVEQAGRAIRISRL